MQALRDLRRRRRARRLEGVEWFDLAYRVYLTAFFGGSAVIIVSDAIGDAEVSTVQAREWFDVAPGAIGVVAAVVVALALRSGADGGPVSVETADVRHLLSAPVPRRWVLARPLAQRLRSLVFSSAVTGAIAGQLAAQRLPGSAAGWAAGGAMAGAAVAVAFVAIAVIAHAARLSRPVSTALGVAVLGVQVRAAVSSTGGPTDPIGHLALLGWDRDPVDGPRLDDIDPLVVGLGLLVPLALCTASFAVVGRLRTEPLMRRGALVSQLRFAVTVQDLRTVVVLRRQLRTETPRRRPWWRSRRRPGDGPDTSELTRALRAGRRRGLHGLARTPASRLVRVVALSAVAGWAAHTVIEGTTPMLVVVGVVAFLIGLDLLEPLSQEIDRPDLTDRYPLERGVLHLGLMVIPTATLAALAMVAAGVVLLLEPGRGLGAVAVAIPLGLIGLTGSAIAVVRDSDPPRGDLPVMMPPEFAGFRTALRTVVPVAVSMLAGVALLVLRSDPGAGVIVRVWLGAAVLVAGLSWWVRRRDQWGRAWREATSQAAPQGSTR